MHKHGTTSLSGIAGSAASTSHDLDEDRPMLQYRTSVASADTPCALFGPGTWALLIVLPGSVEVMLTHLRGEGQCCVGTLTPAARARHPAGAQWLARVGAHGDVTVFVDSVGSGSGGEQNEEQGEAVSPFVWLPPTCCPTPTTFVAVRRGTGAVVRNVVVRPGLVVVPWRPASVALSKVWVDDARAVTPTATLREYTGCGTRTWCGVVFHDWTKWKPAYTARLQVASAGDGGGGGGGASALVARCVCVAACDDPRRGVGFAQVSRACPAAAMPPSGDVARSRVMAATTSRPPWPRLAACAHEHSLAIIVPYREQAHAARAKHLKVFLDTMTLDFLPRLANVRRWHVFVVEQHSMTQKFNRGALLNVGARYAAAEGYTALALHDVDLVPAVDARMLSLYDTYPLPAPVHPGAAWGLYRYPTYVGGVFIMHAAMFAAVNGFPNTFWGWGGEDDAFGERMRTVGVPAPVRPRACPETSSADTKPLYQDLEAVFPGTGPRANVKLADGGDERLRNSWRREDVAGDVESWRTNGVAEVQWTCIRRTHMSHAGSECITVDLLPCAPDACE